MLSLLPAAATLIALAFYVLRTCLFPHGAHGAQGVAFEEASLDPDVPPSVYFLPQGLFEEDDGPDERPQHPA